MASIRVSSRKKNSGGRCRACAQLINIHDVNSLSHAMTTMDSFVVRKKATLLFKAAFRPNNFVSNFVSNGRKYYFLSKGVEGGS